MTTTVINVAIAAIAVFIGVPAVVSYRIGWWRRYVAPEQEKERCDDWSRHR